MFDYATALTSLLILSAFQSTQFQAASVDVDDLDIDPQLVPEFRLDEVAAEAGVLSLGFGRGAAMVDLDRDGLLDLISLNGGGYDLVYRQRPDHTFANVTSDWGFLLPYVANSQSWAVVAADFDNDGDKDVFIGSGGFYDPWPNQLLRNDLDTLGRFTDVTSAAGSIGNIGFTFAAVALDYDRDGLLDLFHTSAYDAPTSMHLMRNTGGLVFQDVTVSAGIAISGEFRGCSAGDFDNDGWPDIGVGHQGGPNSLLRNRGDGTFVDVAAALGVDTPGQNFGMMLEDFDNDGWQDLYIPQRPNGVGAGRIFKNDQGSGFIDFSSTAGFTPIQEMGHNTGDIDADGFPDVFIGSGSMNVPDGDLLWGIRPKGQGFKARDLTVPSGMSDHFAARTHGSVFGDYDNDGDVDLYVNNGGPSNIEESAETNKLFRNAGGPQRWVKLALQGVISNRDGIGARASLVTALGKRVERQLSAGRGFGNTDSPILHFGLDDDLTLIQRITIYWPSGIVQVLDTPGPFQTHAVVETGLSLQSGASGAGPARLRLCGPAGSMARITSVEFTAEGLPRWLGFPNPADLTVRLPESGLVELPLERFLAGGERTGVAYLQAWVQDRPGAVRGAFTNVVGIDRD